MWARVPDALKKVLVAVLLRRLLRERRDASLAQKRLDMDARMGPDEVARLQAFVSEAVPRTWVLMDEAHVFGIYDKKLPLVYDYCGTNSADKYTI